MSAPQRPDPHPAPSGLRASVERASRPLLLRLVRLPSWAPFVIMLGLMVGGVLVGGGAGAILIGVAVLVLLWLLYLAWPGLRTPERLMRLAVIVLAVGIIVVQLVPR